VISHDHGSLFNELRTIQLGNFRVCQILANLQVSFFGTAGGDFKELRFIATTPGSTLSGSAKKQ
jgi:hypothetical protein